MIKINISRLFKDIVIDALEKTEPGASKKNIVNLTPAQRRIIFADAKAHTLGLLHHFGDIHDK